MPNEDGKLSGKVALIMGAGQTPGQSVGNGRATALLFAREGAQVVAADRDLDAAQATVDRILKNGGDAVAVRADVTVEADIKAAVEGCVSAFGGRIDVLHNNVGVSLAGGDATITETDEAAFSRCIDINLRGMVVTCKHVLPIMRAQGSGAIVSISSLAAITDYPYIAYRTSKAGVNAMTENIAITEAKFGIRANAIMPGLMNTPMAIENRVGRDGATRADVIASRDSRIPLGGKMGSGWDVAKAALFLASDDAAFITGVLLPVDGGQQLVRG
ncbi:NAD(P)-dependent dehydrogenase (short-subunit alcohol dehydrogenase family) [Antricoccus suffuscus]|uniref:NAD(P)-dependent dehydrogenase (Short-subunit alcohol dehydrogenase family) n=1 Tax=Antricoccus suffuscus TaxID=1629062 RepID=A0A2T1A137_9ACTN|nr:SDR family NAD(P)-dependent oxidoreductase [Antricoccus suffuscus]PRZ42316.1 NAD(P)-dependent dehydrogenase (short-subunit alcohol dehydrogenase family) [Antricoccus suffuscus]